jgi:hypothetical protein
MELISGGGLVVKHVLLNNIEHKELRIASYQSAQFGDNVNYALIVPSELKTAKNFYPIFIQKDSANGHFFFSALFGFQEGENLFLDENGWNAEYIPLSIMRQPFLIGQQSYVENGEQKVRRVIHIDMDSPRIHQIEGRLLFNESGMASEYLEGVANMLEELHHGLFEAGQLIERLISYNLLEPLTLKVAFNNHKKYEIPDMYTINEDVLRKLSDEQIVSLYRDGSLEKIYSILHSQARVSTLIRLKNLQDSA